MLNMLPLTAHLCTYIPEKYRKIGVREHRDDRSKSKINTKKVKSAEKEDGQPTATDKHNLSLKASIARCKVGPVRTQKRWR